MLPETLALAGSGTLPYPLRKNTNGKTAGVVQYVAPFSLGHYVLFNQEGARHQYTCSLASVGTQAGASIPASDSLSAPCP